MHNTWQVVVLNSLGQVSSNGPPTLILLLPPFISHSLPFPSTPLLFPHYPIPIYILHRLFIPSQCPHSYCILALPPYPPFSLFWTVFSHLPAISTLPYHFTSIAIVSQGPPFTSWPIPSPCPCLPPCPHFRFFGCFFDALLHVFLSHFVYTCTYMIISIEWREFNRYFGV